MNYGEKVCQAVDTIVQAKLKDLSFNTTETCTIIDNSLKDQGHYIVNNGSISYSAYSTDTEYKINDTVYVTIPNDDYREQKIITGKKLKGSIDTPYVYQSPMEFFVKATENLCTENEALQLKADELSDNAENFIGTYLPIGINLSKIIVDNAHPYSRLGLTARFRSLLPDKVKSGEYGIELAVYGYGEQNTEEQNSADALQNDGKLNCAKMYGDPYHFLFYTTQEMVFEIPSSIKKITKITARFYQKADFNIISNNLEEDPFHGFSASPSSNDVGYNLFADNIGIYLGYDKSEFTGDNFNIYTNDSLVYNDELTDPDSLSDSDLKTLYRTVMAQWDHIDSLNEAQIFRNITNAVYNEDFQGFIWEYDNKTWGIKWYRENPGAPSPDTYCGPHWKIITPYPINALWEQLETYLSELTVNELNALEVSALVADMAIPETKAQIILSSLKNGDNIEAALRKAGYKKEDKYGPKVNIDNPFEMNFYLDLGRQEDIVKAILIENLQLNNNKWVMGQPIHASPLVFNNKFYVNQSTIQQKANDLIIYSTDGTNSNYNFYRLDGKIKDTQLSNVTRYFDILLLNRSLNGSRAKVVWTVPAADSMLIFDKNELNTLFPESLEYLNKKHEIIANPDTQKDQIKYYRVSEDYRNVEDETKTEYKQMPFKISSMYNQNWVNNIVKCAVYFPLDSIPFTASQVSVFGTGGTSGTQYSFYLTCEKILEGKEDGDDSSILHFDNTTNNWKSTKFLITPHLRDSGSLDSTTFEEIDLSNTSINWSWVEMENKEIVGLNSWPLSLQSQTTTGNDKLIVNSITDFEFTDESEKIKKLQTAYSVLKATMVWGDITLSTFLPFSFSLDENITGLEGVQSIYYDSASGLPFATYNTPYHLLSVKNLENAPEWQLQRLGYIDNKWQTKGIIDSNIEHYYSRIDENNVLIPAGFYIKGLDKLNLEARINGELKWISPLLILQNAWPSETLNNWDGSVEVNANDGYIAAPSVIAGTKNPSDNTFSGIMMGKVQKDREGSLEKHGIYGFQNGIQTISMTEDGVATFGGPSAGRIIIDGSTGLIESASHRENSASGMSLDFAHGKLSILKPNHYQGKYSTVVRLYQGDDAPGTDQDYLIVNGTEKRLLNIGNTSCYLQSNNYKSSSIPKQDTENNTVISGSPGSGTYFNLNNGKLYGYDFNLYAEDSDTYSYVSLSSNPNKFLQMRYRQIGASSALSKDIDVLYVGKNKYFLKSFNYQESKIVANEDSITGTPGKGIYINLGDSPKINAYDFELRGEDSSGSYLQLSSNPNKFIQIHYKEPGENGYDQDVLRIGKNKYYLKSFGYKSSTLGVNTSTWEMSGEVGKGVLIDLNNSSPEIQAYNFELYGEDNDGLNKGSYMKLTSNADKFIEICYRKKNNESDNRVSYNHDILHIGSSSYYLRSFDYNKPLGATQVIEGTELNMEKGSFTSYHTTDSNLYVFKIRAESSSYPLQIGKSDSNEEKINFKVNWDGTLKIGPLDTGGYNFTITPEGRVTIKQGEINLGNNFEVDSDGKLKAVYGTIGGWTINSDSITGGSLTLKKDGIIEGSTTINNLARSFNLANGYLQVSAADFKDLVVGSSLSVAKNSFDGSKGAGSFSVEGSTWLRGNVYINTENPDGTGGVIDTEGKLVIRAKTDIDTSITIAGEQSELNNGTPTEIYAGGLTDKKSGLIIDGYVSMKGQFVLGSNVFINIPVAKANGKQENVLYEGYSNGKITKFKVGTLKPVYLKFSNGILIGVESKSGAIIDAVDDILNKEEEWDATGSDIQPVYITEKGPKICKMKLGFATNNSDREYAVDTNNDYEMYVKIPEVTTGTSSHSGLMTSGDKTKLNSIATGAEVNQNAFSFISVPGLVGNIQADSKTSTLSFDAGSNINIVGDKDSKKITISAVDTKYSAASSSKLGLVKIGDNISVSSGVISLTEDNVIDALGFNPATRSTASSTTNGLMSSTAYNNLVKLINAVLNGTVQLDLGYMNDGSKTWISGYYLRPTPTT